MLVTVLGLTVDVEVVDVVEILVAVEVNVAPGATPAADVEPGEPGGNPNRLLAVPVKVPKPLIDVGGVVPVIEMLVTGSPVQAQPLYQAPHVAC